MPGPLESSTIGQYKASCTNINKNEVPALGRNTRQQALNDEVENKRKITITCKTSVAGSYAKEVDYTEPFIFHSAAEACITRSESKRAKAVKTLDECLSERFHKFSADDSILNKLSWMVKSTWASILNINSMVDQGKIASQQLPEFGVANVKSAYDHVQVIKSSDVMTSLLAENIAFNFLIFYS